MNKKPNIIFILNNYQAFYGHKTPGRVKPNVHALRLLHKKELSLTIHIV